MFDKPELASPRVSEISTVGTGTVGCYRCLFLKSSGSVETVEIVDAVGDEDALLRALKLLELHSDCLAVEIWQGARKVFPVIRARADAEQFRQALRAIG